MRKWPGDDATGAQAAQLMLCRQLWLQQQTRRAVRRHRADEAAFLARAALETCIVGLYLLFGEDAVARFAAANYRAVGKSVSYMTDAGLVSKDAIDAAIASLGATGPNPNIADLTDKLANQHGMPHMRDLYAAYYLPLSTFYIHANAFTLLRHVGPGEHPRRSPARIWARRPAAHLADACTGMLAANIASQAGSNPEPCSNYAQAHLNVLLTPAFVMAIRGARRSFKLQQLPRMIRSLISLRAYTHGKGFGDDPATQETRIRDGFVSFLRPLEKALPESALAKATDDFIAAILTDMRTTAANKHNQPPPSEPSENPAK